MKHTVQITGLLLPICFILASCDPWCSALVHDEHYVSNKTDKSLILGIGIDNTIMIDLCYPYSDSSRIYSASQDWRPLRFKLPPHSAEVLLCSLYEDRDTTQISSLSKPTSISDRDYIEYRLYCLPDTTSLNLHAPNQVPNIERIYHLEQDICTCTTEYHLVLTEAMIATMEKDTSMLTTFPEYYGTAAADQ